MTRSAHLRLWAALTLVLVAGLFWANRDLFTRPAFEEGDHAANALSIERAKHGAEILGNYSRFRFHHPGPAFFYVYAAGEWVLCDLLHAVPTRHNAHLLAGIALQAAFLATLLALLAAATPRPAVAAWLFLAVMLPPLAFVPGLFSDLWPPYVLLLPLATLAVAAATLAAGERRGWTGMVLAAGFLLHGHVAQPLFVGPLVLLGLLGLWWRSGRPAPRHWATLLPPAPTRWILTAVLGLFALPPLLDLAHGRASNLVLIVQHFLAVDARNLPGWREAAEYTLSFLALAHDQERWWHATTTGSSGSWLAEHWRGALAALLLSGAALVAIWRMRRAPHPAATLGRPLAVAWALLLALALYWARRQDGGLLNFNSYFLFGLVALWPVFPLLAWPALSARVPPWAAATLGVAVAFGYAPHFRSEEPDKNVIANQIAAGLPALLAADPLPTAPKFLLFPSDNWYEAVTLAAALQRHGIPFFVSDEWTFMFGESHALAGASAAVQTGPLSAWSIAPGQPTTPPAHALTNATAVRFATPERLPPATSAAIRFGLQPHEAAFPAVGIAPSDPATEGAWTESRFVWLRSRWEPRAEEQELVIEADAIRAKRQQTVEIWLNGHRLATWSFTAERVAQRVRVPPELWALGARDGITDLRLLLPNATPPSTYKASLWREHRRLGIRLYRLQLAPAATAQPATTAKTEHP